MSLMITMLENIPSTSPLYYPFISNRDTCLYFVTTLTIIAVCDIVSYSPISLTTRKHTSSVPTLILTLGDTGLFGELTFSIEEADDDFRLQNEYRLELGRGGRAIVESSSARSGGARVEFVDSSAVRRAWRVVRTCVCSQNSWVSIGEERVTSEKGSFGSERPRRVDG